LSQTPQRRILHESTLSNIKAKASWIPYELHENPFKAMSHEQLKKMLGVTDLTFKKKTIMTLVHEDDHIETFDVPNSFDARREWPDCISEIRKQEHCGSCWAFSAAETLTDRFCIGSKGKVKPVLSPQYIVSCDQGNLACNGGEINKVWAFLEESGTTTDECTPYVSGDGKFVPKCNNVCTSNKAIQQYKAVKGSSKPLNCALQIQRELIENGPVQTGFEVYEDFLHYKSGIYHYADGIIMGGHAVKIVGWGKENGVDYWIVANSWGPEWGENGFFRIKFGECYFDENAYVGNADLSGLNKLFLK